MIASLMLASALAGHEASPRDAIMAHAASLGLRRYTAVAMVADADGVRAYSASAGIGQDVAVTEAPVFRCRYRERLVIVPASPAGARLCEEVRVLAHLPESNSDLLKPLARHASHDLGEVLASAHDLGPVLDEEEQVAVLDGPLDDGYTGIAAQVIASSPEEWVSYGTHPVVRGLSDAGLAVVYDGDPATPPPVMLMNESGAPGITAFVPIEDDDAELLEALLAMPTPSTRPRPASP